MLAEVADIFVDAVVTLMGAHTVGHVHIDTSGFGFQGDITKNVLLNAWDDTPTLFDNLYFINLQDQVSPIHINDSFVKLAS